MLQRLESLAIACEAAAKEVEKASAEFTLASGVRIFTLLTSTALDKEEDYQHLSNLLKEEIAASAYKESS